MGAASKKKQIGFVTGKDTKPETGNRKRSVGPLSEGPRLGLLRIRVTPFQYNSFVKSKFVKLRLNSKDGKFALDLIVKDTDSHLELVPRSMPSIAIEMDAETFGEKIERKTIVMLENGAGQNKGYKIVAIREVELMNDGKWAPAKKHFVN
jgi:hypothetical protein